MAAPFDAQQALVAAILCLVTWAAAWCWFAAGSSAAAARAPGGGGDERRSWTAELTELAEAAKATQLTELGQTEAALEALSKAEATTKAMQAELEAATAQAELQLATTKAMQAELQRTKAELRAVNPELPWTQTNSSRRQLLQGEVTILRDRLLAAEQSAALEKLRAELSAMKVKALKKRAKEVGVDEEKLEDADDEDDVKGTVIGLILEKVNLQEETMTPRRESIRRTLDLTNGWDQSSVASASTVSPCTFVSPQVFDDGQQCHCSQAENVPRCVQVSEGVPPRRGAENTRGEHWWLLGDAMTEKGLTPRDQAKLRQDGVSSVEDFAKFTDEDFETSGIDISQRRKAKHAADKATADANDVRELLAREAPSMSPGGVDKIVRGEYASIGALCGLRTSAKQEKDFVENAKRELGLSIADSRLLSNAMAMRSGGTSWSSRAVQVWWDENRRCQWCRDPLPPDGRRRKCTRKTVQRCQAHSG